MAVHTIHAIQRIPASIQEVWDLFSNAKNLQSITPANMGFKVISLYNEPQIYPGQIIEYTVSPVLGIPLYWMTEITHVRDKEFFIDEQRLGPYAIWHHQHHFKIIHGGIEMTDLVHYKNPLGFLGEIANSLFVKNQLKNIFVYRYNKIEEYFGKWNGQVMEVKIV